MATQIGLPDTQDDQSLTKSTQPVTKPPAPIGLPAIGGTGGVAGSSVPTFGSSTAADPLAFAPPAGGAQITSTVPNAPTWSPLGKSEGSPFLPQASAPQATLPNAPTAAATPAAAPAPVYNPFDPNSPQPASPLSGLTEAQKDAYWATQGANVNLPGFKDQTQPGYDQALATLKNDPASQALATQVQGAQAGNLAASNAASNAYNADAASKDRAQWAEAEKVLPGITQTMLGDYGTDKYDYSPVGMIGGEEKVPGGPSQTLVPKDRPIGPGAPDGGYQAPPAAPGPKDRPIGPGAPDGGYQAPPAAPGDLAKAGNYPGMGDSSSPVPVSPGATLPGVVSDTGPAGGVPPAYSTAPIDPNNALLSQTITPDAGLDRFKIANDQWQNYVKSTEPGFKADADTIAAQSFGAGRGVSGMNRTREGNLALARARDINTKGSDFLNNALTGSIEDAKYKTGVAQEQQNYQAGRSDTAFNQEKDLALLNEMLTSGAFGRAQAQEGAGYSASPADVAKWISENYGRQAGDAGNAAAGNVSSAARGSSGPDYQAFLDFMQRYQSGRNNPASQTGTDNSGQEYIPE